MPAALSPDSERQLRRLGPVALPGDVAAAAAATSATLAHALDAATKPPTNAAGGRALSQVPRQPDRALRKLHGEQVLPGSQVLRLLPQAAQGLCAMPAAPVADSRGRHPLRGRSRMAVSLYLAAGATATASGASAAAALPRTLRRRRVSVAALRLLPRVALLRRPAHVRLLSQKGQGLRAVHAARAHAAARRLVRR